MAIAGALSQLRYNNAVVFGVGSATISTVRSPIEITEIGANNSYFLDGVQTTTAQLDLFYEKGYHLDFYTNLLGSNGPVFTELYLKQDATTANQDVIRGCSRCTQMSFMSGANDVVRASVTLVFDGFVEINEVASYGGVNEGQASTPFTECAVGDGPIGGGEGGGE